VEEERKVLCAYSALTMKDDHGVVKGHTTEDGFQLLIHPLCLAVGLRVVP
jgi:hypothetical protein